MLLAKSLIFPYYQKNNNDAYGSIVRTMNSCHELKFYIMFFIGITDQNKYKQKQFLSWVLLHNFIIKIIAKKPNPIMEYVCLNHSIIHFRTDRFDKLKYLSRQFFFNSYFLGKVAGRFPQTNGSVGIKILVYSWSHHLKEFNNYFLWEWGARRGGWGIIFPSGWEWLFLPWQFDSFTTLLKGKKETIVI